MIDSRLIDEASAFLAGRIRKTPLLPSQELSRRHGRPVFLKLENLQLTGSFKVRGALFALYRLGVPPRVATCSAGNHGLGLAYAAWQLGSEAVVHVPSSVDPAKLEALRRSGSEVSVSPHAGFDESEEWAVERARAEGWPYLSAYDDEAVLAGNGGSLALEILADLPDVAVVVAPVGGGGLAAGIAAAFSSRGAALELVAVQLAACPALVRSLEAGAAVTRMPAVETLAGGLEGGLGRLAFEVLRERVSRVDLVDEDSIRRAVRWALRAHDVLVEPSAAAALAACLGDRTLPGTEPAVVVVTGRNVAARTVHAILGEEDQSEAGRVNSKDSNAWTRA